MIRAHPLSWTGRVQEEKVVRGIRDRFCTTRCGTRSRCSGSRCFSQTLTAWCPACKIFGEKSLEISFSFPSKSPENFPLSSLADNSAQGTTRANAFASLLENLDCFSFLMFLLKDHTVVCLFVTMPKWPKTQESGYWRRPNNQANWKGTLLRQGNDRFWIQRKRSAISRLLLLPSDTDPWKKPDSM